jgi:hypothetical protein
VYFVTEVSLHFWNLNTKNKCFDTHIDIIQEKKISCLHSEVLDHFDPLFSFPQAAAQNFKKLFLRNNFRINSISNPNHHTDFPLFNNETPPPPSYCACHLVVGVIWLIIKGSGEAIQIECEAYSKHQVSKGTWVGPTHYCTFWICSFRRFVQAHSVMGPTVKGLIYCRDQAEENMREKASAID